MADTPNSNTKRLDELLAPHRTEMNVLSEALKEIDEEDGKKRKQEAKDLVRQALELQKQLKTTERNFNKEKAKFEKQLGKLLNRINAMAKGEAPPEDEDEKKDEKDD